MPQSMTIGRVTADLELQTSANGNNYVRFNLAENLGYGSSMRTQYLQVWAWGDDAEHLINGRVKKGSLIWVAGQLMLEEYKKLDGVTSDKRLKVILDSWGYIPAGKPKNSDTREEAAKTTVPRDSFHDRGIDGDKENLPE